MLRSFNCFTTDDLRGIESPYSPDTAGVSLQGKHSKH
jgi:hypothetical protein